MSKLTEGMRQNDLEDMVLPMITVDEYVSKVDESAIVVGFYVNDKDAAEDLNRFIQKSAVPLLDTEVSPAPDQHGFFLVFLELMNDTHLVDHITAVLDEVSPLTGTETWQMRLRGTKSVQPFSSDVLEKRFAELREDAKKAVDDETAANGEVLEFLTPSDLSDALIEGSTLVLRGSNGQIHAEFVAFGEYGALATEHHLKESALSFDFSSIAESSRITQILGEQWSANRIGVFTLIHRTDSVNALLLRDPRFR